jgi:hypothetical protein
LNASFTNCSRAANQHMHMMVRRADAVRFIAGSILAQRVFNP